MQRRAVHVLEADGLQPDERHVRVRCSGWCSCCRATLAAASAWLGASGNTAGGPPAAGRGMSRCSRAVDPARLLGEVARAATVARSSFGCYEEGPRGKEGAVGRPS